MGVRQRCWRSPPHSAFPIARTPHQRVLTDKRVAEKIKTGLSGQYRDLNPAQLRRDILGLSDQILELVKAKHQPRQLPLQAPTTTRASSREATKRRTRAS